MGGDGWFGRGAGVGAGCGVAGRSGIGDIRRLLSGFGVLRLLTWAPPANKPAPKLLVYLAAIKAAGGVACKAGGPGKGKC